MLVLCIGTSLKFDILKYFFVVYAEVCSGHPANTCSQHLTSNELSRNAVVTFEINYFKIVSAFVDVRLK